MTGFLTFSVSNLEIWHSLLLGFFWALGVVFIIKELLAHVQRKEGVKTRNFLKKMLTQHRETAVEKVGNHVEGQLEGLKQELKDALADKVIAQNATIVAEKAQVIAEEESDNKTQFLSRMSHEIRTPMNGIIGSLDLINLDEVTDVQAEDIQRAVHSSNRLLHVIDEILTFSSVESNEVSLKCESFNLATLCREVVDSFKPLAEKKDLKFALEIDNLRDVVRFGDEQKIHQVLTNLLGNAIKFTEKGMVTLSVSNVGELGVKFKVKDTGIGVDKEYLKTLFDPFFQVDESNTRKYGGTGLGLAISQRFVQKLGGEITAKSSTKGSIFQFELSLCIENCFKKTCPIFDVEKMAKFKILVVDDDEVNMVLAKRCLADICSVLDTAKDGEEALSMVQGKFYDLILMDIQMPVMDGFEASRKIRKHEEASSLYNIPIVAVSASVIGDIRDQCEAAGMNGYVSKPFKKNELVAEVYKQLENFKNSL